MKFKTFILKSPVSSPNSLSSFASYNVQKCILYLHFSWGVHCHRMWINRCKHRITDFYFEVAQKRSVISHRRKLPNRCSATPQASDDQVILLDARCLTRFNRRMLYGANLAASPVECAYYSNLGKYQTITINLNEVEEINTLWRAIEFSENSWGDFMDSWNYIEEKYITSSQFCN